ncbi:Acyltransferase family protein [Sphingomonas palmae]|uniref:Acyltransferase family protein n=1 Tax=Sphingomonas palmae TaxID=1855283 RepID=A0A1H7SE73_9SPHN|nr:acyltransferase [Sphingomonas palmae]SEL70506.1 Acyltransferase family protein [Sphingomonas palmae]
MQRHYGLDWLRIGAFALLILYHVGMVFVPWDYHVKLDGPVWATVPMMASNPWRLSLLFIVSGYASRVLLKRQSSRLKFARNRTARLLVPLIFGMAVIVPPQAWVELVTKRGYPHGFAWFWLHDYFRFDARLGMPLPTWNHLWFVAYLWIYTLAITLAVAVTPKAAREAAQRGFEALFRGPVLLLAPLVWMVLVNLVLFPGGRETHAVLGDWVAHATYFPAFLFGFALARADTVLASLVRWWKLSATIAVASFALVAGIELTWPGVARAPDGVGELFSVARAVEGWFAIAALIGFADSHWNRDHRWRPMLTEAVFPFYIIHQTLIVVIGWWLRDAGLPMLTDFLILVAATVAGCWAFYLVGRRIPLVRPLIGLRRHASRRTHVDPRPAIA